jgi:FkbM family methyltransferase
MGRIFNYRRAGGTLLFVSHDAASVERVCDRAILLIGGRVVNDGPPMDVLNAYHRRLARPTAQNPDSSSPQHALGGDNEWGNGRVRILNPRLVGPEGPATNFASGDPVEVVFEVEATEPVPYPCFGAGFFTVDGHIVWGTNTQLESFTTDTIVGRRTVRFTLDQLPLHEGRFTLQVSAVSPDLSEIYHWIDRCVEFSVFQQDSGIGIVRMSGRWSLSKHEEAGVGMDNRTPVLEESAIPRLAGLLPRPLVVIDVGCRWGFADMWHPLEPHVELVGFDPDATECRRLAEENATRTNFRFVPQALADHEGERTLYVTAQPACSSFYPPNKEVVVARPALGEVFLVEEVIVPVTTLDRWTEDANLAPDFIKLDVQGAELGVLKGAERCLTHVRALEIEVCLNPMYQDQPLLGDIDCFLRERGFVLWRLGHLVHYGLAEASPAFRLPDRHFFDSRLVEISGQGGQVFWGHAWYVRAEAAMGTEAEWDSNLRDACLAGVLGFRDLAREAADRAARSAPDDARPMLDLLATRP